MDEMRAQYEVYPYPERDPADEARRLITGSPSWPQEMDHHLWGGARDWSRPLRVLVAGGGTGDGLIQLAQCMRGAGRACAIDYVDMSAKARRIAEARAAARGLEGITFHTGSLLEAEAAAYDYIDCCGVLHHLPEPQAGFDALARALAPGGGIGLMVYAPLGRSGVYPLQEAFRALLTDMAPEARLAAARAAFARVPDGHPFKRNPHLVDHKASDAGFYDLLLHSSDRAFGVAELWQALSAAGLDWAGMPEPLLYDPAALLAEDVAVPDGLSRVERMTLCEKLRGTMKTHVVYARRAGEIVAPPLGQPGAVPHLRGVEPRRLAEAVARKGRVPITVGGQRVEVDLPRGAARLIALIDGRRTLGEIRTAAGLDPLGFGANWGGFERAFCGYGVMHYSRFLRGAA